MSAIGAAYVVALAIGFAQVGFDAPIADPVLAVMEGLTLLSAIAILTTMAVVHQHAADERRIFGVLALSFTVMFASITSTVHFVMLTASRQLGLAELAWPSAAYAAELLAWDWFLGLALLSASQAFSRNDVAERSLRRVLLLGGVLTLAGTLGPLVGDMRIQRIGIVGYALVLPIAFLQLSLFFRRKYR